MCKKLIYLTFFFAFCPMAVASDIAISTQANWWPQAAADREMQEIVNNVTAVSVERFTSTQHAALADWVRDHTGDGVSDLLILCGIFPAAIYPAGNAQPEGSLAELFLDDGNTIINTGDYMFYVGSAGNNDAGGLQNMMDIPGITMWDPIVDVTPTADGQAYTPSFQGFSPSRPWHLDELTNDWEAELILGQDATGTRADPAIVVNTVTDGRLGTFFQVADTDTDLRGEVISEWINNWFLKYVAAGNPYARRPEPKDGATGVTSALLQWKAGDSAAYHEVYFGTNPTPGPDEFRGRQAVIQTVYYHAAGLVPGTTYYWRIDEVEADETTIHTGNVWSFSVPPLTAANPEPPDGAKWIQSDVTLSWDAGWSSIMYQVYLSADLDAVTNGTNEADKGIVGDTSYAAQGLDLDTTYYWRVDAFDDKAAWHTGDVWSFTTMPVISISDPNLLGWWTLDEGEGTTALDWSGHGNHGVLRNEPQWVLDGYHGGALAFDGRNDYVSVPLDVLETEYTAALWFSTTNGDCGLMAVVDSDLGAGGHDRHIYLTGGNIRIRLWDTEEIWTTGLDLANGLWHHVAYTYGATIGGQRVYVDGVLRASGTKDASDFDWQRHVNIGFSNDAANDYFEGVLDDVRIYYKTLTQAEIQQVMRGDPLLAWNPTPANASIPDIEDATALSWSPGDEAAQHDVYLGTDQTAVENADTSDTTGVYRARQAATSYTPPEALGWGQTYYWRIDEVNTDATISPGRLWSFTVANYLIPDDFEAYDDYCNRIFYAWKDGWGHSADPDCGIAASGGNGTGSTVGNLSAPFAEQTIVHGGIQSMPFAYDNSGATGKARYSEAQREWAVPQDWTKGNVKGLTLWFHGETGNTPETLYVALEDSTGQVRVATHSNPEALQGATWQEWNIDLQQFSGVNLASVEKLYLGVGNRSNPQAGGSGKLYIDDIRVYPARCVPSLAKPAADLSDNCIVDYADVEIVADQWLDSGFVITPTDPGNSGLIAHYPFNGNANDVVGGHNGTTSGMVSYATGKVGQAIQLDGVDDYVDCGTDPVFNIPTNITVTCWIKVLQFDKTWQAIVTKGDNSWRLHRSGTSNNIAWGTSGLSPTDITGSVNVNDGQWHHVAGVYDGTQKRLYVDGNLDASSNSTGNIDTSDYSVYIGENTQATGRYWTGLIDEVRVYSRALSGAEIAWLAGRTSPFSIPADLYQDDVIDFKDLAVLGDSWLEEILWP